MELKDMRAFYAIVEEGNISHAAQRLAMAQSALSRQMQKLEAELAVRLFERGSRRIRLTEAGRVLAAEVGKVLGMVDGVIRDVRDVGKGVAGEVRIGAITSSGAMLLPQAMALFQKSYPKVTFKVWESEGARVLELLANRVIDIAITRTEPGKESCGSFVLEDEPLVAVMPEASPVGALQDTVRFAELQDVPLILPLRWKDAVFSACEKAGFSPQVRTESDSIVQDVLLARAGLGVALVPASARSLLFDGGLRYKQLAEPAILTHTVISWRKGRALSAAARAFLSFLSHPQSSMLEGNVRD